MFLLLIELDDAVADEDIEELKENEKKSATFHAPTVTTFKFFFSMKFQIIILLLLFLRFGNFV